MYLYFLKSLIKTLTTFALQPPTLARINPEDD